MTKDNYAGASVSLFLPSPLWRLARGDEIPPEIMGATIRRFGGVGVGAADTDTEGGGLVIDFVPAGRTDICRIVFGFNELGMWVEYQGACEFRPSSD
jgi:hypothetical protein